MYVGNIVNSSDIKEENFKICNDVESIDKSLPTIIIGWNETKKIFGDEVSILHKKIKDDIFWTFSMSERKVEFENDIEDFKHFCYNRVGKHLNYLYVDPLHNKLTTIKKIIRKIYSLDESMIYISPTNMLYILGEDIIFGLDLNVLEFIGIPDTKIISRIKTLSDSTLIGNEIFNKCKVLIKKLNNREKLVPYIVKNGEY
jgi:hypothetical protein